LPSTSQTAFRHLARANSRRTYRRAGRRLSRSSAGAAARCSLQTVDAMGPRRVSLAV